jgi:molybdate transport system substrate-binding protein
VRRAALAVVAAAVALGGCGGNEPSRGESSLRISAATSLKTAFESCAPNAKLSFGGSDELAAQIRHGAKPDVFAAANTKLPDQLAAAGRLETPKVFAGNRLVIAVPTGSRIRALGDLQRPGTRLVIGAKDVPVGSYTREVLARYAGGAAVLRNVRSEEPDVGGVVAKVAQKAADAGFVYVTDVVGAQGKLRGIELPASLQPRVRYGVGIVKGAHHGDAARAFLKSVASGRCEAALGRAGFTKP